MSVNDSLAFKLRRLDRLGRLILGYLTRDLLMWFNRFRRKDMKTYPSFDRKGNPVSMTVPTDETEIAYQVPGKSWKRRTFTSEARALQFVATLRETQGDDVEVRWLS